MTTTLLGPLCKCGCGDNLPYGSTRNYKRGHKPLDDALLHAVPSPPANQEPDWHTVDDGVSDYVPDDISALENSAPLTLANAASITPDDKPPADFGKPEKPKFRASRRVQQDVEAKLTFYLSLTTTMLEPLDPVCFGTMKEHTANVASKLTPIMCQSPEVVRWLTKAGNFALYADLAMALWPVVQVIIAHHITKSIRLVNKEKVQDDYSQYSTAA
jgi:hypothetical protein